MSNIPPIEDGYIDDVIKSSGPLKPNLNKTQGIELRALVKLLRDRLENEIVEHYTANQAALSQKVDQIIGKQLSTEDFSTSEKQKLASLKNHTGDYIEASPTEAQEKYIFLKNNPTQASIKIDTSGLSFRIEDQEQSVVYFGNNTLKFDTIGNLGLKSAGAVNIDSLDINSRANLNLFVDGLLANSILTRDGTLLLTGGSGNSVIIGNERITESGYGSYIQYGGRLNLSTASGYGSLQLKEGEELIAEFGVNGSISHKNFITPSIGITTDNFASYFYAYPHEFGLISANEVNAVRLRATNVTGNRNIEFPDGNGTLLLDTTAENLFIKANPSSPQSANIRLDGDISAKHVIRSEQYLIASLPNSTKFAAIGTENSTVGFGVGLSDDINNILTSYGSEGIAYRNAGSLWTTYIKPTQEALTGGSITIYAPGKSGILALLSDINDNFLPLTGGTLTGRLTVNGGLFYKSLDLNNTFFSKANNDGSFIVYNDATGAGWAANTAGLYNPNNNRKYVQEKTDAEFNSLNITGNANIGSGGSLTTINSFGLEEHKPLYLSTENHYLSTATNISFANGDLAVNREGVGFKTVLLQGDALPITGGRVIGNISASTLNNLTIDFNKGGTFNTRIGVDLFGENIIGSSNVAIGQAALKSLNIGGSNLGVGDYAGAGLTIGSNNVAIGANALRGSAETNSAVAIGKEALSGSGNYSNSVAIGHGAGVNSNGGANVYLGSDAGAGNTGSGNVFIGFHAGYFYTNPMSNKFIVSNGQFENESVLIKGDFVTKRVEIEKLNVSDSLNLTNGDIEINDYTKGMILKSPNGNRWRITISDTGILTTVAL